MTTLTYLIKNLSSLMTSLLLFAILCPDTISFILFACMMIIMVKAFSFMSQPVVLVSCHQHCKLSHLLLPSYKQFYFVKRPTLTKPVIKNIMLIYDTIRFSTNFPSISSVSFKIRVFCCNNLSIRLILTTQTNTKHN